MLTLNYLNPVRLKNVLISAYLTSFSLWFTAHTWATSSFRQDNNQIAETNASNESMSPWSWNNRGRSSERGWARFHGRPAETNPLPPPPPPGRCAWGKSGSHLKLISRLKSVCRRQIGRIKSTEGPWHRRSSGPLSARPSPPLHLRTPQVLLARSDWD